MSEGFKNVAKALARTSQEQCLGLDVYSILHLADAVMPFVSDEAEMTPHDLLVHKAKGSEKILAYVHLNKKIHAIKELRSISGCGLKEAKEACEDPRVIDAGDNFNEEVAYRITGIERPWKSCEHGLSADLCDGPNHYPLDHHNDEPPF